MFMSKAVFKYLLIAVCRIITMQTAVVVDDLSATFLQPFYNLSTTFFQYFENHFYGFLFSWLLTWLGMDKKTD
ncbi:hypothetical protein BGI30_05690 [Snodgrassella alvi]|nr:hypothetical protein BGI30_05690 [Snodgrassella alvi]